jgi:hypothetical protein
MKWIVEVTHDGTGEELVVQLDAGTHEEALAVTVALSGLGGCFATPGNAEIKGALLFTAGLAVVSVLGLLTALAMTHELRRGYGPDPLRGFDVVRSDGAEAATPGLAPREPKL